MDKKNWMQRAGVTPGKMVVVAVLAVVLVGVLVLQLGGSTAGSVTPRRSAKEKDAGATPRAADKGQPAAARKVAAGKAAAPEKPWPQIPLEEILTHDPLATPAWLAPPSPATAEPAEPSEPEYDERRERLKVWEQLCGQGVAVVLITPDGPVATVGDRRVREGDLIDGFRVEKIDGRGMVLADPKEGSRN